MTGSSIAPAESIKLPRKPPSAGYLAFQAIAARAMRLGAPTTLAAIGAIGKLARTLGAGAPSPADFRALLPHLSEHAAREAAAASAALRFCNHAEIAFVRRYGIESLAAYVSPSCHPPAILSHGRGVIGVSFHVGSHFGSYAAYTRWGIPLHKTDGGLFGRADYRARLLKSAVDAVRAGAFVPMVLDGPGGMNTRPFACLGRQIVVRRGALTLARLSGAPVVPVTSRWTPRGIELEFGEPLNTAGATGEDIEYALAAGAARWLERLLERAPGELWPFALREFLRAPLTPSPAP